MHQRTENSQAPESSESKDHNAKKDFDSQFLDAISRGQSERVLELINNNSLPVNLNLVISVYTSPPILTYLIGYLNRPSLKHKKVFAALIDKATGINPNEKSSLEGDEPLFLKLIRLGEIELASKLLEKSNASVELQPTIVPKGEFEKSVSMNPIAILADLAKKGVSGIETMIKTLLFMSDSTPAQYEEYAKIFPEAKAIHQIKEKISIILDNYAERKGALFFQKIPLTQRFNWCLELVKDINLSDKKKCELFLNMTTSHQRNCDTNAIATIPGRVLHEYFVCSGIKETASINDDHQKIFKNMIGKVVQDKLKELTEQKLGKYRGSFIVLVKNKLLAYAPHGQLIKQRVVEEVNHAFYEATWPDFISKVESVLSEHLLNVPGITEKNKGYNKNLLCSVIFREFANEKNGEHREAFFETLRDDLSQAARLGLDHEMIRIHVVNVCKEFSKEKPAELKKMSY